MTLYDVLVKSGQIESETSKYRCGPHRVRQKKHGYMWEDEKTVRLKDGRNFTFKMWNHFQNDTGGKWSPSEKSLKRAYFVCGIPIKNKLYDSSWHMYVHKGHYYGSIKGWFGYNNWGYGDEAMNMIKNGTWENDSDGDIHLII